MNDRLSSHDERGPLLHLGPVQMFLTHDPLGMGRNERHGFTLDLWQLWRTTAQARACIGDRLIKSGSDFNDYYGFGTSFDQAKNEADAMMKNFAGAAIEVRIMWTVEAVPTAVDPVNEAFYFGTVRCFSLPRWKWMVKKDRTVFDALSSTHEVCAWVDGVETSAGSGLREIINRVKASEDGAHLKKGRGNG